VGALMRQAGLELMQLIMEDEVRRLAGERCQRRQQEQGYRWGREDGFLVVDGQKVKVQRPRVRSTDGHEQTLGSYELFRRGQPLDEAVWDKLLLEISTRNYAKAVRQFAASYGLEKSAVSEHFIRVSRRKVRELLERDLSPYRLCAIYLDGIEFKGQHMVVALGVQQDGRQVVLGLRQGASENAVVTSELLRDLNERGVDFTQPRLYVVDGAKALLKAVRQHAGEQALVQRCQLHIAGRDPRYQRGGTSPPGQDPTSPGAWGQAWRGDRPCRSRPDRQPQHPVRRRGERSGRTARECMAPS
jgi:transposase-like protein